jgi:hypothetical protein
MKVGGHVTPCGTPNTATAASRRNATIGVLNILEAEFIIIAKTLQTIYRLVRRDRPGSAAFIDARDD